MSREDGALEDYAQRVEEIVDALTDGRRGRKAAIDLLALPLTTHSVARGIPEPIDTSRDGARQTGTPSKTLQAQVFQRDGWRCRYCGWRLGPPTVTWIVRDVLGDEHFPHHRNRTDPAHWHPLAAAFTAECEHVYPKARGGAPKDPRNLVAACFNCARSKKSGGTKGPRLPAEAGMTLLPIVKSSWNGLVDRLKELDRLERRVTDPYGSHGEWRSALQRASATPLDARSSDAQAQGITATESRLTRLG